MNAALRAKAILTDPLAEWQRSNRRPTIRPIVLTHYVALLAIIPACSASSAPASSASSRERRHVRVAARRRLVRRDLRLRDGCATVLLLGLFIYLLAPLFGGRRDFDSAFKLAVYSFTPVWLAGIFLLLPGLHFLALIGFYGLYILWLGLPRLTKVPEEMSLTFAIAIAACACLLIYVARPRNT